MKQPSKPFNGYGSINNTLLEKQLINRSELYKSLPQIGYGDEGSVHQLNDFTAIKIFCFSNKKLLSQKFDKIEFLGNLDDDFIEFPQKIVGFDNLKKAGYSMNLVKKNCQCSTLAGLVYLKDNMQKIKTLVKADDTIKRIHKKNIFIGDIRGNNILIDENWMPRFIDTDNYAVADFGFDIQPMRTYIYKNIYKKSCSMMDNDKFLFAILALQGFIYGTCLAAAKNPEYFKELIQSLDINKYSKDILNTIFSDANDKPYIGEMLNEIEPEKTLIKIDKAYSLNAKYIYSNKKY